MIVPPTIFQELDGLSIQVEINNFILKYTCTSLAPKVTQFDYVRMMVNTSHSEHNMIERWGLSPTVSKNKRKSIFGTCQKTSWPSSIEISCLSKILNIML